VKDMYACTTLRRLTCSHGVDMVAVWPRVIRGVDVWYEYR